MYTDVNRLYSRLHLYINLPSYTLFRRLNISASPDRLVGSTAVTTTAITLNGVSLEKPNILMPIGRHTAADTAAADISTAAAARTGILVLPHTPVTVMSRMSASAAVTAVHAPAGEPVRKSTV